MNQMLQANLKKKEKKIKSKLVESDRSASLLCGDFPMLRMTTVCGLLLLYNLIIAHAQNNARARVCVCTTSVVCWSIFLAGGSPAF